MTDFEDGQDVLDLTWFGFGDADEVLSLAEQFGGSVEITLSFTDRIILKGFDLARLDASDFIL